MASQHGRRAVASVKPILSLSREDAHRRVLNLYRDWYRQIPGIRECFMLNLSVIHMRSKIKDMFYQNKDMTDLRAIDMLVIKGNMELNETLKVHKQPCHVYNLFVDTYNPKSKDFISKFLEGKDSE